jgi:flagellin-like protein
MVITKKITRNNEQGVSPVIGVILIVAIAVVMASLVSHGLQG